MSEARRRLFVALELPEDVRGRLGEAITRLKSRAGSGGLRIGWVPPENIHLTLKFLGSTPESRISAVQAALAEVSAHAAPVMLHCRGLGAFPSERAPRVLWAAVEEPDGAARLAELASRVELAMRPLGFEPEERRFRAHATLARVKEGRLAVGVLGTEAGSFGAFRAREIVLFESRPIFAEGQGGRPSGTRYEALARFPLAAA